MKRIQINALLILSIATIFAVTSCKKAQLNKETVTSEDDSTADNLLDDVFNAVEEIDFEIGLSGKTDAGKTSWCPRDTMFTRKDSCTVVERLILDTSSCWPRRVIVDFGTGCTGKDGRVRKGKIMLERTGRYRTVGSVSTYTTDEYFVDGYKVEGTRTITNDGKNGSGNTEFTVKLTAGKITTPNNEVITKEYERVREWIEGESTLLIWKDDVYSITGGGSGVNRNGRPYTLTITTPLRVEVDCRWIVSGSIELEPKDLKIRKIDYGNGLCDDQAEVTVGKKTKTITLRK